MTYGALQPAELLARSGLAVAERRSGAADASGPYGADESVTQRRFEIGGHNGTLCPLCSSGGFRLFRPIGSVAICTTFTSMFSAECLSVETASRCFPTRGSQRLSNAADYRGNASLRVHLSASEGGGRRVAGPGLRSQRGAGFRRASGHRGGERAARPGRRWRQQNMVA